MQALQDLEVFEIEVLELLNSIKVLDKLYFGGGTMLRLCHNLNRYSTDLDFWLDEKEDSKTIFLIIKKTLSNNYKLVDSANKKFTLLFEIKTPAVNRSLKIEVRKEQIDFEWERKIPSDKSTLESALQIINNFKDQEYKVTLGSILEEKDRKYYLENRFKFLKEELTKNINRLS